MNFFQLKRDKREEFPYSANKIKDRHLAFHDVKRNDLGHKPPDPEFVNDFDSLIDILVSF